MVVAAPCNTGGKQKLAEAASRMRPKPAADEASAPPALSKRQQHSAQRLQEFQEKKRAALVQELVSKGTDSVVAEGIVARDERKRLEYIVAHRATPMDAQ